MRRLALVMVILSIQTGCTYVKSKQKLDLAPFAENTISLAAEIEYGLTESSRLVNLRELWDDPAIIAHRRQWEKVRALMKGVVAYSVELTTLGSSTLDGPARAQALADFLDPLARPVLAADKRKVARLGISAARMDSILADIRTRKDLLDALGASQPIIDEVARVADNIFDEVAESLDETGRALIKRIDEINRNAVYFEKVVNEAQYSVFRGFVYLRQYRTSHDPALLDSLFAEDPQLLELVANPKELTLGELQLIEDRLFLKTQSVQVFVDQIRPDIERYHLQQIELADLYKGASHQLRRARTTMLVWARAHRNLALGITDPAKVNLFDITKKALKTAL